MPTDKSASSPTKAKIKGRQLLEDMHLNAPRANSGIAAMYYELCLKQAHRKFERTHGVKPTCCRM